MIHYHTLNKLTEHVYQMTKFSDEDDIDYEITSFFRALMSRRRNDDIEEGLQAGGVIYPEKAGFKICERDGVAGHAHAQENVSQHINGIGSYTGEENVGMMGGERKTDPNAWFNISKNGFAVRIVATKDMLIFIFNTYSYRLSQFQLEIIYKIVNLIRNAYNSNKIDYPYINFVTSRDRFIFNENKDYNEQLDKLNNLLIKRLEDLSEKTRTR